MRVAAAPIYLDYNATTPIDPRVAAAMLPYLQEHFGNPSSAHVYGRRTREAVENARRQAAALLQCPAESILFTSGGTEANNHALVGAAMSRRSRGNHLITSAVEHPAISAVLRHLETLDFQTTVVPVDANGRLDPEQVVGTMTDETILVTLMHANNEVGTLQPVAAVAAAARQRGILTHSDCAQSVGKVPVTLDGLGVDMISLAGHKLYGPKGVGLLCIRPGLELPPLLHGAGHEQGRRPGTENVMGVVGLGTACELAGRELAAEAPHLAAMRDQLQAALLADVPGSRVNGSGAERLPNTLSIGFPGVDAGAILAGLPEVAVSAGAACHDGRTEVSAVLHAMGTDPTLAAGTLRISLGRMTTEEEIGAARSAIVRAVRAAV